MSNRSGLKVRGQKTPRAIKAIVDQCPLIRKRLSAPEAEEHIEECEDCQKRLNER